MIQIPTFVSNAALDVATLPLRLTLGALQTIESRDTRTRIEARYTVYAPDPAARLHEALLQAAERGIKRAQAETDNREPE